MTPARYTLIILYMPKVYYYCLRFLVYRLDIPRAMMRYYRELFVLTLIVFVFTLRTRCLIAARQLPLYNNII